MNERQAVRSLLNTTDLDNTSIVVDLGTGAAGPPVLKNYAISIGIDWAFNMLKMAKRFDCASFFIQGDSLSTPIKSSAADVITAIGLTEYLRDHDAFLTETGRILKPGGHLLITTSPPNIFNYLRHLYNPKLNLKNSDYWRRLCLDKGLKFISEVKTVIQTAMLFRK